MNFPKRAWERPSRDEHRQRGKRRGRRDRSERPPASQGDAVPEHPAAEHLGGDHSEGFEEDEEDVAPGGQSQCEAVPELPEEELEELETPSTSADNDIDEEDTLSDWNVPSWTELIASLYRPER